MKPPMPAARPVFHQLAQELLSFTQQLADPTQPEIVSQIHDIALQLSVIQTLTLFEDEYICFCDLIICGSNMAEYLLASHNTTNAVRHHAHYWQKLTKTFKPFLQGMCNHSP